MNSAAPSKPGYRKQRLFPRALDEVVKAATRPLMDKQGKLYGALLRDWASIVGAARANVTRPQRLQFPHNEASGATLHLDVRPAASPALSYEIAEMLEQCARYFGYRAIDRIVLHPVHGVFQNEQALPAASTTANPVPTAIPPGTPQEMRGVLERIAAHVTSAVVKKDPAG